jgi:serine protease Do
LWVASLCDAAPPPVTLVDEEAPLSPKLKPLGDGLFEVTFTYVPKTEVEAVYLAGSFNEWKPTAHKMDGPDREGRFSTRLKLKEGRYEYKFVLDGRTWTADPENVLQAGLYHNSVLHVGTLDDCRAELAELESEIMAAYKKAAPAVVRIGCGENVYQPTGVILTEDGYAIASASFSKGQIVTLNFADGRQAKGTVLGRCKQWSVSVVRISDPGPWPHVDPGNVSDTKAGEMCIALEYARMPCGQHDQEPHLRVGTIGAAPAPTLRWIQCNIQGFVAGFCDLKGRLIGVTGGGRPTDEWAIVGVDRLAAIQNAVAAGKPVPDVYSFKAPTSAAANADRAKERYPDEEHIAAALQRAKAASVRIAGKDNLERGLSGTIVTADGYVYTCGHHRRLPGEEVKVFLPDGRAPDAIVLGLNPVRVDVGLVKITDEGPWPYVELGDSVAMKPGDVCLGFGYPVSEKHMLPLPARVYSHGLELLGYARQDRPDGQPLVRQVAVVDSTNERDPEMFLYTSGGRETSGGDSGGGLFDVDGRVIAVHIGWGKAGLGEEVWRHGRVELFKTQWDLLTAAKPAGGPYCLELDQIRERFSQIAERLPPVAVEVATGRKRCVLGTVVDPHGWILTKASELDGEVSCRFSDGRDLSATVHRISHEYDLALLKVDADDLPQADWSDSNETPIGALVAAVLPGMPPIVGVIAHPARPVPPESPCELAAFANFRDGEHGLEVVEECLLGTRHVPFRKGDIIVDVQGRPTPNLKSFLKLDDAGTGVLPACPGDPIRVGVKRAGSRVELRFPMPSNLYRLSKESARRSGLPVALDADISLSPDQCGGPVIDRSGRVIGITAARRRAGVYVIPTAAAREVARTLMR